MVAMTNYDKLSKLPDEVKDEVFLGNGSEQNHIIVEHFGIKESDFGNVLNILVSVIVKEIPVLDFPLALSKLNLQNIDSNALALAFAEKRLWPLQQYLGNVDVLIRRLGGQVPTTVPVLKPHPIVEEETEETVRPVPMPVKQQYEEMTVREYLAGSSQRREYKLTKDFIRDAEGNLVLPMVENWIKDYMHFAGAVMSDSLTRSEYLVKSANAKKLNESEKTNLLNFLTSYGEDKIMRFTVEEEMLAVTPLDNPAGDLPKREVKVDLNEALAQYGQYIEQFESSLARERERVTVESGNLAVRLADILWNSLGLGESDRVLAALSLLATKQYLPQVLAEDQRFIGIVRRYINVRFGEQAKNTWLPKPIALEYWLVFFNLILVDKLRLPASQAACLAQYLLRLTGNNEKLIYLDLTSGQFRFREVMYQNKRLQVVLVS